MFGNLLGWGISAVLALLMGLFVWVVGQGAVTTPPTPGALAPAFVAPLTPPPPPSSVVAMDRSCPGNPYRRALELYQAAPDVYERLARATAAQDLSGAPALRQVIDAADCRSTGIFIDHPEELINYQNDRAPLDALQSLGMTLTRMALLERQRPEIARGYYRAAFALGAALFAERLSFAELSAGMDLMARSAAGLKQLAERANDAAQAQVLGGFGEQLADFARKQVLPHWQIISAIDQRLVERHAGDVFLLAADSQERLWRVEAMLKLGRYRFNAGRAADQRGAARALRRYARTEADPVVRLAAQQGLDLTIEQYRRLR